jgi:hypothetical protein
MPKSIKTVYACVCTCVYIYIYMYLVKRGSTMNYEDRTNNIVKIATQVAHCM